ncbi:hypothetical protein [Amphritea sp. HPY]|uniref:hypothetical protein n=1 Tax=Amphritea sp. HPY TaxID=3421652 RepID=UPI003D7DC5E8
MANNKRLSVIIGAIDKLSGPVMRINSRIEKLRAPVDRVNRSLNKLGRQSGLKKFNRDLKKSARQAKAAGRAVAGLAKIGAGIGLAGIGLASSYANAGDNIAKTSQRLGFGVEALQEYRFAADRSGIAAETFDMAVQRFGRRAGEAANGMGEARTALKALGVELKDSGGNIKGTEELLIDALNKLGKVKDPLTRNALAMKLFDSEGVKMVQMAAEGAEGISKLREEARQLGLVMSEAATKDAEAFKDKLTNLTGVMTGLKNVVGGQVLPIMASMIERFTVMAKANIPLFKEEAKKLSAILSRMGNAAMWISENFGLMNTVFTVLGAVIAGKLIIGVVALAGAFKTLGITMMTTPIGWIVAGIAAVVAGAVLLYKHWDKVKDAVVSFAKVAFKYSPFAPLIQGAAQLIKMLSGFNILDSLQSKLQGLLPKWAIDLLALGGSSKPVTAAVPNAQAQVGGSLHIKIDSEGRPRVQDIQSDNSNMGLSVDAGMMMAGP